MGQGYALPTELLSQLCSARKSNLILAKVRITSKLMGQGYALPTELLS